MKQIRDLYVSLSWNIFIALGLVYLYIHHKFGFLYIFCMELCMEWNNEELIKYWQLLIIIFINSSLVWRIFSLFLALNWAYNFHPRSIIFLLRMCSNLINKFSSSKVKIIPFWIKKNLSNDIFQIILLIFILPKVWVWVF